MIDKENFIKFLDGKYYIGTKELIESIQSGKYDVKLNKDQSELNQYCHTDINQNNIQDISKNIESRIEKIEKILFSSVDEENLIRIDKFKESCINIIKKEIEKIEQRFIKIEEKIDKIDNIIHDFGVFISEIYFKLFVSEKNMESKK